MTSPGAMVPRSPLAPGDAETAAEPAGEAGSAADSEQAAREWADQKAAEVGLIWISRFPTGKDWLATE